METPYRAPPEETAAPLSTSADEPIAALTLGAALVGWVGLTGLINAALSILERFAPGGLSWLTRALEAASWVLLLLVSWLLFRKKRPREDSSSTTEFVIRMVGVIFRRSVLALISTAFWAFLLLLALFHMTPDNLMGPETHRELLDWAARSPDNWWELFLGSLGVLGLAELLLYLSLKSLDPAFSRRVFSVEDQRV